MVTNEDVSLSQTLASIVFNDNDQQHSNVILDSYAVQFLCINTILILVTLYTDTMERGGVRDGLVAR